MFTSPTKREIRYFHVVVVQCRQRNAQKNPIAFLPLSLSLPSPMSLLKLPIAVQREGGEWGKKGEGEINIYAQTTVDAT